MEKLKGAKDLLQEMVEKGTTAVEDIHKETADRYFNVLEEVPLFQVPVKGVRLVHDAIASNVYDVIRLVNRGVGMAAGAALDGLDRSENKNKAAATKPE